MNSIGSTVSSVVVLSDGRQNEEAFQPFQKPMVQQKRKDNGNIMLIVLWLRYK